MLAEGTISGLFSIPLMYLASTLTIRFLTPTMNSLYVCKAQKSL